MPTTGAFSRLWVKKVRFEPDRVVVWVALRRKKLVCPKCSYSTMARANEQDHGSVWRHVDCGARRRLVIRARLRRLRCPEHGCTWRACRSPAPGPTSPGILMISWRGWRSETDQTAITRLVRIDWETVGRIVKRVGDELLPADRLSNLFEISLDEVAWRKSHSYLAHRRPPEELRGVAPTARARRPPTPSSRRWTRRARPPGPGCGSRSRRS
jgi:hypothetical protein